MLGRGELERALLVKGSVAPGFEPVKDALLKDVGEVGRGGAAFAVVSGGQLLVDLWVGSAGPHAWQRDTRAVLMSATKGVAACVVGSLIDAGVIDYRMPVSRYWPAFATNAKRSITVGQLLAHSSGIITLPHYADLLTPAGDGWEQTDEIVARLEQASPAWRPGRAYGYHGLTYNWLVGELVRRSAQTSLGSVLRKAIAEPLDLDLEIGTSADCLDDVARVLLDKPGLATPEQQRVLDDPESLYAKMLFAVDGSCLLDTADRFFNEPARLSCELPASNGTGTARSVARLYSHLVDADSHDLARVVSSETVKFLALERFSGMSQVTARPERWGNGFQRPIATGAPADQPWGPQQEVFGYRGLGGQIAFADPVARIGVAFVRNHLSHTSPLSAHLVAATYGALAQSDQSDGCTA